MLVIKNSRLIPELTEGYDGRLADIIVDDNKISKIAKPGEKYDDAEIIDAQGKSVLPGFFELHTHLHNPNQNYHYKKHMTQLECFLHSVKFAKEYLKQGFTTVRDCGTYYYVGIDVREAIKEGIFEGPRIIASGKILTPTTRGNSSFGNLYVEVDNPSDMMKVCRNEYAMGADLIKYMVTGAVLNEGGKPGAMVTTPEELKSLVKAAKSLDMQVSGHCHGKEGILQAAICGIDTIEHGSFMDEECVETILKYGNKSAIIPTYSVNHAIVFGFYSGGIKKEFQEKTEYMITQTPKYHKMAYENGIKIGFGTDIDRDNFAKHPGLEFTTRKSMGLPNTDILKQATIESAKIVGLEDQLGTIKVGKLADLVIIDGNPDKDLDVMKKLPVCVIKEGKRVV